MRLHNALLRSIRSFQIAWANEQGMSIEQLRDKIIYNGPESR
jgi:hypothetical protein